MAAMNVASVGGSHSCLSPSQAQARSGGAGEGQTLKSIKICRAGGSVLPSGEAWSLRKISGDMFRRRRASLLEKRSRKTHSVEAASHGRDDEERLIEDGGRREEMEGKFWRNFFTAERLILSGTLEKTALWSAGLLLAVNQGAGLVMQNVVADKYEVSHVGSSLEDVSQGVFQRDDDSRTWRQQAVTMAYYSEASSVLEAFFPHQGMFMGREVLWEGADFYGKLYGDYNDGLLSEDCVTDGNWMTLLGRDLTPDDAACAPYDTPHENFM